MHKGLISGPAQITNIRIVKEAMQEAAYMLAELSLMGAPMAYLDVGGGLAVDYDGSKSDTSNSFSYTMQQYANDVVATVQVCSHGLAAFTTPISTFMAPV